MQTSIWEDEVFFKEQDVVIVGSGLNGLWAAWHLKQQAPSLDITILERGDIPTGASTRNAGFACFGSAGEMAADLAAMGPEKVWQLAEMRYRGLELIKSTFRAEEIDLHLFGGYEIFDHSQKEQAEQVIELLPELNRHLATITGNNQVFSTRKELIPHFGFNKIGHLVYNPLEGQLHSGKLVAGLMKKVLGAGVRIMNGFETIRMESSSAGTTLTASNGRTVTGKKVLICNNAFAGELIPELEVVPARGQVLVTAPIEDLKIKGCFHFDEGYYYFRNLGNRVILGGARNSDLNGEETTEMQTSAAIQNKLELFLREVVLPGKSPEITHRWAGIMGMGAEKTPIIREVGKGVFCCVRMSGMGVALAPVAAKKAAELLCSA
ncbi:MAG: NAD(P)/FAD-dependent oxidoreductase [Chitinophagaceae bacterium]